MYSRMYLRHINFRPCSHDGAVATVTFANMPHHPFDHAGHFEHNLIVFAISRFD